MDVVFRSESGKSSGYKLDVLPSVGDHVSVLVQGVDFDWIGRETGVVTRLTWEERKSSVGYGSGVGAVNFPIVMICVVDFATTTENGAPDDGG